MALTLKEGLQRVLLQFGIKGRELRVGCRCGFVLHVRLFGLGRCFFTFLALFIHEGCQCPWRLLVEEVVEDNLHTVLAGFHDDLDGIEAGTANLEEIVEGAHLLNAQHLGEDAGEELFGLAFGGHIVDAAFQFGHGQGLAVDFSVGSHRHGIEAHIGVGHHVFGQRRCGKGGTEALVVDGGPLDHGIVEHQVLVAHHLAHLGGSLADALDVERFAFNLAQFDAESAQLDLGVDTSHVLYLSVLVPAAQVAGVVHAHGASPTVLADERAVDKRFGRAFGQAPIAASHLDAGEAQLTGHALGHQVAGRVDDEVPVVGHALADGNVLDALSRRDAVVGRVVGTLGRAINVDNLDVVAVDAIHLLAATCGEADGQVVEGVEQQAGHGRGIAATGDAVVDEELAYGIQVLADFSGHDVERAAQGEHGVHVLDVGVERE